MTRKLFAGLFLLCGCDLLATVDPGKIKVPALPVINLIGIKLPKDADGKYLLMRLSESSLEIDPTIRDAITALGECDDQITYCFSPNERSLDECVRSVTTCKTSTPWNELPCCPKKCQDDYAAARTRGVEPATALDTVLFAEHTCFPGVTDALAGK